MRLFLFVSFVGISTLLAVVLLAHRVECYFSASCHQVGNVIFISNDPEKIASGVQAHELAERRFNEMFDFQPPFGVIILDQGLETPYFATRKDRWELRFDPAVGIRRKPLVIAAADINFAPKTTTLAHVSGELAKNEVGVISHEICHVLFATWAGEDRYSDVMNEVAAISCEPPSFVETRLERFSELYRERGNKPWDRFLSMKHPVKERTALAEGIARAAANQGKVMQFTVNTKTDLGQDIDLFYAQSAAFVEFWRIQCPNEGVFDEMFRHLEESLEFSEWLDGDNRECGPQSLLYFEEDFDTWMAKRSSQ